MGRLRFGTGGVRVEMDDTLDRLYRRAIERVAPGILTPIEDATNEVFTLAFKAWPVKTGRSAAALQHHVTVNPDQTQVRGSVTNDVKYARYIKARKLGGKSAFVELLQKPMRRRAKALVGVLASATVRSLKGG